LLPIVETLTPKVSRHRTWKTYEPVVGVRSSGAETTRAAGPSSVRNFDSSKRTGA
jgi:hypothetical protein